MIKAAGTARTPPSAIRITAVGQTVQANVRLTNETLNQYFQYTDNIYTGQVLVVNCEDLSAKRVGVDALAHFLGDFWKLNPGDNTLRYEGPTTGVSIQVEWRDRYF
jgi:hypothetical protein